MHYLCVRGQPVTVVGLFGKSGGLPLSGTSSYDRVSVPTEAPSANSSYSILDVVSVMSFVLLMLNATSRLSDCSPSLPDVSSTRDRLMKTLSGSNGVNTISG